MSVDYGIDGELLEQIRRRAENLANTTDHQIQAMADAFAPVAYSSAAEDRRNLLNIIDRLLKVVDDQAKALRLLQDGIGDTRTEIIKDM